MNRNYNLEHWISSCYYDYANHHGPIAHYDFYVSEFHPLFLKVFETIEKSGINIEDREYLEDFFDYCRHVVNYPCLVTTPCDTFKEFVEETKKLPLHDDTNDSE